MSPRETPVAEETIRRWVRLRRAGWSFARIGKSDGIDRRTVARLVRRYEGRDIGEALASARQEVAARLLEQHFADLEGVAMTLLRLVSPPSFGASLYMEPPYGEDWLEERLAAGWLSGKVYLPSAGPDALDRHLSQRRAQIEVAALAEHCPQILKAVEEWSHHAREYHRLWITVEGRAMAVGIAGAVARASLEEALRNIKGKGGPAKAGAVLAVAEPDRELVERWLYASKELQAGVKKLLDLLEQLEKVFFSLEDMLEPGLLHRALLGTRCRLCPV